MTSQGTTTRGSWRYHGPLVFTSMMEGINSLRKIPARSRINGSLATGNLYRQAGRGAILTVGLKCPCAFC